MDVMRVLAAILLLGNLRPPPSLPGAAAAGSADASESFLRLSSEAAPIAELLGISVGTLFRALCIRTHWLQGQLLHTYASPQAVSWNIDFVELRQLKSLLLVHLYLITC